MYDEKIERFSTDYVGVTICNASGAQNSTGGRDDVGVTLPIPVDSVHMNNTDTHKTNTNVQNTNWYFSRISKV